jgi:transposase
MTSISITIKEAIIKKALSSNPNEHREIAKNNNIGYSSLKRWVKERQEGQFIEKASSSVNECSSADKLNHLLSTNNLGESEVGSYCRRQGIYSHQLVTWKEAFMKEKPDKKTKQDLKALKSENKRLKKELHRKDRALAETSALLILKKKASLIWGEDEDA